MYVFQKYLSQVGGGNGELILDYNFLLLAHKFSDWVLGQKIEIFTKTPQKNTSVYSFTTSRFYKTQLSK
jgi:hypothetical protein